MQWKSANPHFSQKPPNGQLRIDFAKRIGYHGKIMEKTLTIAVAKQPSAK